MGLGEGSQPVLQGAQRPLPWGSLQSSGVNRGPVTEMQKLPVMSVSNRPQTKDSRNSERGRFCLG